MSMFPELDAMMNRAQKGDLDAIQSLQQEVRKTLDLDPDVSGGVMPDGSRVGSAVDPNFASTRGEALEPSDEPRFGDRLRAVEGDWLPAEPFLERLGQIFSASSGEAAGDELCCSTCGRPYVIHGINCPTLSRNSK